MTRLKRNHQVYMSTVAQRTLRNKHLTHISEHGTYAIRSASKIYFDPKTKSTLVQYRVKSPHTFFIIF